MLVLRTVERRWDVRMISSCGEKQSILENDDSYNIAGLARRHLRGGEDILLNERAPQIMYFCAVRRQIFEARGFGAGGISNIPEPEN